MSNLMDFPRLIFAFSLVVLWLSAYLGHLICLRLRPLKEAEREDFGIVQAAILTLLGLLIGFTFSMAISRYDQRKNYEEAEANASGTEYVRADLLPAADAARVRDLLRNYLDQRILFYTTRDEPSCSGSTPLRINCKRRYGPLSKPARSRCRHQWLPSPFRA
jgi:hypothetical protein